MECASDSGRCEIFRRNGLDAVIPDMGHWTYPQLHRTEDSAQTPHVLILQIAAVRPSVDLHSQLVAALAHIVRDIEFGR